MRATRGLGVTVGLWLLVGAGAGCVEHRQPCHSGDRVFEVDGLDACPSGYEDWDGDGFGDPGAPLFDGRDCATTPGVACNDGDCQDREYADARQDNRFPELSYPGNLEVCDGIDNDCDPDTWVDEHGEQWLESPEGLALTCARNPEIAFIRDESSILDAGRFDRVTRTLYIPAGEGPSRLAGDLDLRVLRARSSGALVYGALSWSGTPSARLIEALELPAPDCQTSDPASCIDERTLEIDLEVPAYAEPTPGSAPGAEPNAWYLTFLALPTCSPWFVASMTRYLYCCDDCSANCGESSCTPVWDDVPNGDGVDVAVDAWNASHPGPNGPLPVDMTSLKEHDLAACTRFGATHLPFVDGARLDDGTSCDSPLYTDGCTRDYAWTGFACAYLKVVVEPPS